jgi:solute carrier family 24 (sodium/potassium/calcium exchanger), member 1
MFLGLAIICDEYFVASLEKISEALNLSDDVAGATFMAVGSSAPELFTSLADVFFMESGVGIGTIVGSAMFNLLVIVGTTAVYVFAKGKQKIILDWWPLARDISFYVASILLLLFVYWDNRVEWWESLIFLAGYLIYVLFMKFNTLVGNAMKKACGCCPRPENGGEVGASGSENDMEAANSATTTGSSAECGDAPASSTIHTMEVCDVEGTATDSADPDEERSKRERGNGAWSSSPNAKKERASSTTTLLVEPGREGGSKGGRKKSEDGAVQIQSTWKMF